MPEIKTLILYDDDEPPGVECCRDCTTPASCALYERCIRSGDELIGEGEER